jgi:hypothetical protein
VDSSGEALNKRGYRTWNGEAPLRETLAAALILQSGWHPKMPLYDPCCGTGTLLIEAAFIALGRAPGLLRKFAMENWANVDKDECESVRRAAKSSYDKNYERPLHIAGSDIDPEAIELARRHVRQAGLNGRIELEVKDLRDVNRRANRGCSSPIRPMASDSTTSGRPTPSRASWARCRTGIRAGRWPRFPRTWALSANTAAGRAGAAGITTDESNANTTFSMRRRGVKNEAAFQPRAPDAQHAGGAAAGLH